MSVDSDDARITAERARVLAEYARRDGGGGDARYRPDAPAMALERADRRRTAERLLSAAGRLPDGRTACLEVGCGAGGWAHELLAWGVAPPNLHGIDLSAQRIDTARLAVPQADLRVGDAAHLPWADGAFELVVASTLFTSILDEVVRRRAAAEIVRVLAPGGALLWYDFAVDNPRNPHVRRVTQADLAALFPSLGGEVARVTLAPPIARLVAPFSLRAARALGRLPFLRTHLLAVLVKPV